MVKGIGGLRVRLGRRRTQKEGSSGNGPVVNADAMALDESAPLSAPVLVPAVIYSQVLFHATELTPAWARPRPASVPDPGSTSGPTVESAPPKSPKRTRRPKPTGSPVTSRPRTKRVAKPDQGGADA